MLRTESIVYLKALKTYFCEGDIDIYSNTSCLAEIKYTERSLIYKICTIFPLVTSTLSFPILQVSFRGCLDHAGELVGKERR